MKESFQKKQEERPEKPVPRPPLVPTGISGLDEVIGGGLPEKSVVIFAGSPGTGKTTLAAQYVFEGTMRYGEKGLYVCLSETKEKFLRNMKEFGWDFERLEKAGKVLVLDLVTAREVELQNNLNMIMREINEQKPRRVVIDPLTAMTSAMETRIDARFLTHVLYKFLQGANCTAIFIAEIPSGSDFIGSGVEEFIADGVFVLRQAEHEGEIARELNIIKLRGMEIREAGYPFTLHGGPHVLHKSMLINPIRELLRSLGHEVESPGFLKGKSGVRHSFDIVVSTKGESQGTTVIGIATSSKVVSESHVISMFARGYDLNIAQSIFIAIPRLSDEGKSLANAYKINVIEARDADEAVKKLTTFIKNLKSKPK